jgi:hypothetical protein
MQILRLAFGILHLGFRFARGEVGGLIGEFEWSDTCCSASPMSEFAQALQERTMRFAVSVTRCSG